VFLSFCEIASYFATLDSAIFCRVLQSAIFLQYKVIFAILPTIFYSGWAISHFTFRAQSFYDFVSHSTIVLSHFYYITKSFCVLLQWTQSFLWSYQPFFTATVTHHFPLLPCLSIVLQCSDILLHCSAIFYSARPFYDFIRHLPLLQYSVIFDCYST
jgi:hypothetical protein